MTPRNESSDWGFRGLLLVIVLCAAWLLATPWVPFVSHCWMNRYHLRTGSFVGWAIQQPIPSMYSGRNTTEVRNLPPGASLVGLIDPFLLDPLFGDPALSLSGGDSVGILARRTINHFPTREITFANSRARFLSDPQTKWFVLETSYRGLRLRSVYELQRTDSGEWTITWEEQL